MQGQNPDFQDRGQGQDLDYQDQGLDWQGQSQDLLIKDRAKAKDVGYTINLKVCADVLHCKLMHTSSKNMTD